MREKIAFKPHKTRGQEIIKILENIGGVNKYRLDGSQGSVLAIDTKRNNSIDNDWDANEGKGGYFQGDRILGNKRNKNR